MVGPNAAVVTGHGSLNDLNKFFMIMRRIGTVKLTICVFPLEMSRLLFIHEWRNWMGRDAFSGSAEGLALMLGIMVSLSFFFIWRFLDLANSVRDAIREVEEIEQIMAGMQVGGQNPAQNNNANHHGGLVIYPAPAG